VSQVYHIDRGRIVCEHIIMYVCIICTEMIVCTGLGLVLLQKEQKTINGVWLWVFQGLGAARYDACIVSIAVHILVG
jgi:hypothetical protein